jgi:hypothetical protein
MGSFHLAAILILLFLRRRRANKDLVKVSDKCGYYQCPFDKSRLRNLIFRFSSSYIHGADAL